MTQTNPKVVTALHSFKATQPGELSLEIGEEYEIINDFEAYWWEAKDRHGNVGIIPCNYVKEKDLRSYNWYVGNMLRERAESLLKDEKTEGCFVVRNSSTTGSYVLSTYMETSHPHVKHFCINHNIKQRYFILEDHCFSSIPELIRYYSHYCDLLPSRLSSPPSGIKVIPTADLSLDKWEIDPNELMLLEEVGSGQFGVVRKGKWRGCIDTAVKITKEGTMSEDEFIKEAKVMAKLQHSNVVQFYGVCSKHRPIYIITEYMEHGCLLNYLVRHENTLVGKIGLLLDMCIQVCSAMEYLEKHKYVHRDLAARNCLVGPENVVKIADFGLAMYVPGSHYTCSGGITLPLRWAPPEVICYTRFSSKSDVWSYGVLLWETLTCGKMPYGRLNNTQVAFRVPRGIILEKPKIAPSNVYDIMKQCWSFAPEERPSFQIIKEKITRIRLLIPEFV